MSWTLRISLAALALGLSLSSWGCTAGSSSGVFSSADPNAPGGVAGAGGATGADAKAFFDANVQPALRQQCFSCHGNTNAADGPDFLGTTVDGMYDALAGNPGLIGTTPQASLLLNKGPHSGPAFTADAVQAVTEFITLFNQSGGSAATQAVTGKLQRFIDCMSLDLWNNLQVHQFANVTTGDGTCASCHIPVYADLDGNTTPDITNDAAFLGPGESGACLQEDNDQMFYANRHIECISKMGVVVQNGEVVIETPPAWIGKQAKAAACTGAGCHPDYNLGNVNADERLIEFLEETKAIADDPNEPCNPVQ